jgi:hypothetical protein
MEPYKKASEAIRSGEEFPLQLLKNAGLTALGGGIASYGSKALNKLIPSIGAMINQFVPDNMAIAGLKKIDSRFGKFIEGAMSEGYTFDEVRQFLGDKINDTVKNQAKQEKNIIEQYSPELFQFIQDQIGRGRSPIEAGAIAQSNNKFLPAIKKMEKDNKANWSSILESVFGTAQQPRQQMSPDMQSQQMQSQQQSPAMQTLVQLLQKSQAMRGQGG